MKSYRIILADDHGLIRQGIKSIIMQESSFEVMGEAADGHELLKLLEQDQPDMIILDISMPRLNGLEVLGKLRELYPEIRILILTMHRNSQYFYHTISAGAHGYLMKDDSDTELLNAIRTVQEGRIYMSPQLAQEVTNEMITAFREKRDVQPVPLTDREKQVLHLVVKGYTSKKMAELLCLSPRTIDHHRANLLRKFKMKNTIDLVNYVVRNSIVVPD
ncbi:response regulator [Desulfolithobacter dissulfuricans]|nr:response regulator transcription factor [Desulfolithobacter dissulfuricans]